LFSARVRLRVTLSYFVEPNPASRGWQGRYRYASSACASTSSVRQRLSRSSNRRDRAGLPVRYALLVSLRTEAATADIYTPIATQIGIPVGVVT
jgi:hypothetical protein